ncbi:MAG: plasmid recombination protein [Bacteroidales bacterium]|jgi:predicted  nucleic acid-binding Zn-ribbon protein|nr:plasmid recombination protein [Bacteroidales bacterium]
MGYVVLHIQKPKGNDARTSAHIERRVHPANADQSREHLNERLVEYPDGVENRTAAIQHRIETAGITRKIGTNQVRALQVMLSGTQEDMQRIVSAGRLDEWCADNVKWLRDTFGADNLVAAEFHRDEQTPHIHATVVPIVTGERRKAKENKAEPGKRTYRKRPANAARLCADDVMTRDNLERFQNTYAEAMHKYGLQRGIRGSEARHIATPLYYRDLHAKNEDLKLDIAELEETKETLQQEVTELDTQECQARTHTEQAAAEKQQAESELAGKQSELQKVKSELKTEKFKSTAAEAGTKIADGIDSLFGSSKIERQQQEIEALHSENEGQKQEIARLTQTIARERSEHHKTIGDLNAELNKIYEWLPDIKPLIRMGEYCRSVGFTEDMVKNIVSMQSVRFSGKLYSHEFTQRFETTNSEAHLERDPKRPGMFNLLIDGTNIVQWLRQKYDDFRKSIGIKVPERRQNRGQSIK